MTNESFVCLVTARGGVLRTTEECWECSDINVRYAGRRQTTATGNWAKCEPPSRMTIGVGDQREWGQRWPGTDRSCLRAVRIPPCRVRSSVKSRLVQLDLGPPRTTNPSLPPTHPSSSSFMVLYIHRKDNNISSDESHFNVSLIVRDKVTRQHPQTTTFEEKGRTEADSSRGPSTYQPYRLAKPAHDCVCCKRQHLMLEPLSGSCQDCLETCWWETD